MNFFEIIDEYIEGSLSEADRLSFEAEMQRDEELAKAVRNYPMAKKISEGLLEIDIHQTLQRLTLEQKEAKVPKPKSRTISIFRTHLRKWAAAAATAIIALGGGGTYVHLMNLKAFRASVLADHYKNPIDPDATLSLDTLNMLPLELGKYHFKTNHFDKSESTLLQTITQSNNTDTLSMANYWLGHTYLKTKKWNKAVRAFEQSNVEGTDYNLKLLDVLKKKQPEEVLLN